MPYCKRMVPLRQVLLARYSRSEDVVTGTPLANRTRPELEGMQGYLVNSVALRTDMSGALPLSLQSCNVQQPLLINITGGHLE